MIWKKTCWFIAFIVVVSVFPVYHIGKTILNESTGKATLQAVESPAMKSIEGQIDPGETLTAVFQKHRLNIDDLFSMKQAAAAVHRLREVHPGQPYSFTVDENNNVNSFTYGINDNTVLKIERHENGFRAEKNDIPYKSQTLMLGGQIEDSLVGALGGSGEDVTLAIAISDILECDIDFNTDLRKGDSFRVIVEGLYLDGEFKKYGKILAVEFTNDGCVYRAYLFEQNGKTDYYDPNGRSMKKAFLKAPLNFRMISSRFSGSRLHPILKIRRPHNGIDYVAPQGTPVSATSEGRIFFAGYRGAYGKLVILDHRNGMQTYYGHLSRFAKGIRAGRKIKQGDLVGYVGMTGLATGAHLHYEMRQTRRPIDPTHLKIVAKDPVPSAKMGDFRRLTASVNEVFSAAIFHDAQKGKERKVVYVSALKKDLFASLN